MCRVASGRALIRADMSKTQQHLETIALLHEAQSRIRQLEATLNDAYIQRNEARRELHLLRDTLGKVRAILDPEPSEPDPLPDRPAPIVAREWTLGATRLVGADGAKE